jgi:hypothetical protein
MVSAPAPPSIRFAAELPVSVSLPDDPVRFSMPEIVSPAASPPDPAPVARLTLTADAEPS